jgi:hypothetical protein
MKAETVSREARKHVQVNVEYFLTRGFSIREKQIHAIAWNDAASQRSRQALSDAKHLCPSFRIEAREKAGVFVGDHEQMSGIDRTDIEKCCA